MLSEIKLSDRRNNCVNFFYQDPIFYIQTGFSNTIYKLLWHAENKKKIIIKKSLNRKYIIHNNYKQ